MVIKDGLPAGRQGFTLVELLIVIAILAIMIVIMVGILNPIALVNKGYDARKKKDINRIKVAFEEYANDNGGCFPTAAVISNKGLLNDASCNQPVFIPWLDSWPCTPQGKHFLIFTEPKTCPSWFKVATKLDTLTDKDIPTGILPTSKMGGEITGLTANYGVSSTNIFWTDTFVDPNCVFTEKCYVVNALAGGCMEHNDAGIPACNGANCYADSACSCQVNCCGKGCP